MSEINYDGAPSDDELEELLEELEDTEDTQEQLDPRTLDKITAASAGLTATLGGFIIQNSSVDEFTDYAVQTALYEPDKINEVVYHATDAVAQSPDDALGWAALTTLTGLIGAGTAYLARKSYEARSND